MVMFAMHCNQLDINGLSELNYSNEPQTIIL